VPPVGQSPEHSAEEILLAFAAAVRAAGVKVTADRARGFVDAVGRLALDRRSDVFWAGRAPAQRLANNAGPKGPGIPLDCCG
jgi:uncharacterized protein with von Willebrand factor type A (vWA) domain